MKDLALLIIRVTAGSLLMGHGAQKLFGSFQGPGMEETAKWLESMQLRPGRPWALLAGLSEFGGGLLTTLGLLNPMGAIMGLGSMLMASAKVHAGKPIWTTSGGAELPVTNMAIQTALIVAGPGRFSLDRVLGTRLPRKVAIPGLALVVAAVAYGAKMSEEAPEAVDEVAGTELQGGETATPVGDAAGILEGEEPALAEPAFAGTGEDSGATGEQAPASADEPTPMPAPGTPRDARPDQESADIAAMRRGEG